MGGAGGAEVAGAGAGVEAASVMRERVVHAVKPKGEGVRGYKNVSRRTMLLKIHPAILMMVFLFLYHLIAKGKKP